MDLDEFLKHVYHTRLYVIIPAMNGAKLDKRDFLKRGKLDLKKLNAHLTKIWEMNFNK